MAEQNRVRRPMQLVLGAPWVLGRPEISLSLVVALVPISVGLADPYPTYSKYEETFRLEFEGVETQVVAAELWLCSDESCARPQHHGHGGWRGRALTCSQTSCSAEVQYNLMGGGFQRLRIEFADRVRWSNPFGVTFWEPAEFIVTVHENYLLVEPDYMISPIAQFFFFIPLLGITITTEIVAGQLLAKRMQLPRIPGRIAAANLITVPIVWFFLPSLQLSAALTMLLAESFALTFEALFIQVTKSDLDAKSSLILSLGMNGSSFLLGLVIFGIISLL